MALQQLIDKQAIASERILKAYIKYDNLQTSHRTRGLTSERLADIRNCWATYSATHEQIIELANTLSIKERKKYSYLSGDQFSDTEDKYFEYVGLLRDVLEEFEPLSSFVETKAGNTTQPTSSSLKLPRITIPTFSGSYESWRSFHDLFCALVHKNSSLQPVQKLHYLKASVAGEAEHLLRQFTVTNSSYENAWKVLVDRYNNQRVLVNHQLRMLTRLSKINSESSNSIKALLDKSTECIFELEALGVSTTNWDPIIIHLLVQCLPSETHRMWEEETSSFTQLPSIERFKTFLEKRFRTLEAIVEVKSSPSIKRNTLTQVSTTSANCLVCKNPHTLYKCPTFIKYTVDKRFKVATSNRLCLNCLSKGHKTQMCSSKFRCRECNGKHHSLLHKGNNSSLSTKPLIQDPTTSSSSTVFSKAESNAQSFYASRVTQRNAALLSTALIKIRAKTSTFHTFRALIDSGSQVSFITQAAFQKLQLKPTTTSVQVTGLGDTQGTLLRSQAAFEMFPERCQSNPTRVTALIVPSITSLLPPTTIPIQKWTHLQDLPLADPYFHQPGKIDILLGADVYGQIIQDGLRKGPIGSPIAQKTNLGWILIGNISPESVCDNTKVSTFMLSTASQDKNLHNLLQKFWEYEEVKVVAKLPTLHKECEEHYAKTHTRTPSGRYEVKLPFLTLSPDLGESRLIALRRFYNLEKSLLKKPQIHEQYKAVINEYAKLGHMVLANTNVKPCNSFYLPHHAVFKVSTTTKLRVVFDASAKTGNGKSLNEQLHTGPTLQSDLYTILLRWRKFRIAMSADIEKMYRMINVHPTDQDFQRLVWRNHPSEPVKDYKLTTVTFGMTPAPYLAIKSLYQLAEDEAKNYPIASKILVRDFYVDDLLTGADSINEAQQIQAELCELLDSGGFNLRKWVTNSSDLLANIPEEHREIQPPLRLAGDDLVKTLGIHWYPGADYFTMQYHPITECLNTKRSVLSEIAKLFDPHGWISPIVIVAKILMQSLWLHGCAWDDPIPAASEIIWKQFKSEIHCLNQLKIPRWLHTTENLQNCQIHGFSDASIQAYSSAIYIRVIDEQGTAHVSLLMAKTKVAPVKPVSLPRLELCGAVLAARLITRIKEDLNFQDVPIFAWTDSSIALTWVRNHPNKYKTYVANRVAEVQELLPASIWRHVRSSDNPADLNSRGVKPSLLINNNLWWHGPSWLQEPQDQWPKTKFPAATDAAEHKRLCSLGIENETNEEFISKYSSFTTLLRVTAYCLRFAGNCRKSIANRSLDFLSTDEFSKAKRCLITMAQNAYFSKDLEYLQSGRNLPTKSTILSLHPFIDSTGLIRVGGRLRNAKISFSQRHPIILPRESTLTKLITNYYHTKTLHGGTQLVLTTIRNDYWIPQGRKTVRNIISKCIACFRYSPLRHSSSKQLMGDLPTCRVNISRPFQHTGVDYAGPISVKMSKHRGNRSYKAYICLYICMTTKAVHIEPVSDLSTASFIAAFRRFISRRGLCTDMYSDCGTNFVGADKEIALAFESANKKLANEAAVDGIKWHFNPPSAPNFGGLWEAGVKSVKHHLKRVLKDASLTFEEFATILNQIEACLNSRPLYPATDDPADLECLTPGHFLIGSALNSLPDPSPKSKISIMANWKHLQTLREHFWTKWSKDYLNTLQNRPKWKISKPNLTIGDLAIIIENNLPPCDWLLGRILELHQGPDGLVRVVSIRTKNGTLKRPINKLCLLPIQ